MTDFADATLDEIRPALAPLVASNAAFDGWNARAVKAAAETLGVDADVAALCFETPMAMVDTWFAHVDGAMAEKLPAERLATMHPRLRDATALVEAGAVRLEGEIARVRSGDTAHVVRRTAEGDRCTCPWYAKHRGSRGPCKHVLAADLVRKQQA